MCNINKLTLMRFRKKSTMDIIYLIEKFVEQIREEKIEIYNEASIQFELAISLRKNLSSKYKIQLERNITHFGLTKKNNFVKKEIDVVIFDENKKEKLAIELKFPTNRQVPEQMYGFVKDIKFLEQLSVVGFKTNLFIAFADNNIFWSGQKNPGTIYDIFREPTTTALKGIIQKPTGNTTEKIALKDSYNIEWKDIKSNLRYFMVEVP